MVSHWLMASVGAGRVRGQPFSTHMQACHNTSSKPLPCEHITSLCANHHIYKHITTPHVNLYLRTYSNIACKPLHMQACHYTSSNPLPCEHITSLCKAPHIQAYHNTSCKPISANILKHCMQTSAHASMSLHFKQTSTLRTYYIIVQSTTYTS